MRTYLEFEKPLAELESKIEELREVADSDGALNVSDELDRLEAKSKHILSELYARLDRWQKTQVARHPQRPHFKDYLAVLAEDYVPLGGDRAFAEDYAIAGGLAQIDGVSVVLIGHEKGDDTEARVRHNFGMARPEGYRKAVRLMSLADRFGLPVVTLVDTPGAFPGRGAEERGQAEAIARSIDRCLSLSTPLVSVIVGEGGSGGAVALAAADRIMMLEHAIYSVISPEGCASILWRDAAKASEAAEAMRVTAQDLHAVQLVDTIIEEPVGGAHRAPEETARRVRDAAMAAIRELSPIAPPALRAGRRDKFLRMGRTLAS